VKKAIEPRERPIEKRIAAVEQRLLLAGANPAAGGLAVLAVEGVGDVHALNHFAERDEPLFVLIRVVAQADVDLRRTPIGYGERKGTRPRVFDCCRGSSGNVRDRHAVARAASPAMPNCAHCPFTTRKKRESSK